MEQQGEVGTTEQRQLRSSTATAGGGNTSADKRKTRGVCSRTGDKTDAILDSGVGEQRTYSVTIGRRGGADLPVQLFDDFSGWMDGWVVRGVSSMERGDINGHLHLQAVVTLGLKKSYEDEAKEQAALRKKIRLDNGWTAEDKVKMTIKRLTRSQNFSSK